MVRRGLLAVVLVVAGLALINGAAVHQLPKAWVPDLLVTAQRYVQAEGAVLSAVFGLGLLVTAFSPIQNRLWVVLAILYGAVDVALQVDRYYNGQGDVVPPIVFWVAATVLLIALFPTRRRSRKTLPAPQPVLQPPAATPPSTV